MFLNQIYIKQLYLSNDTLAKEKREMRKEKREKNKEQLTMNNDIAIFA